VCAPCEVVKADLLLKIEEDVSRNGIFWDVMPFGSCKNRRFGTTSAFIIRGTRIGELGR
jgi:hypothetical protein